MELLRVSAGRDRRHPDSHAGPRRRPPVGAPGGAAALRLQPAGDRRGGALAPRDGTSTGPVAGRATGAVTALNAGLLGYIESLEGGA
ncbi:MAG: hypothetical protein MZV70_19330 [Desulfobacterales bacterium]|nr:hypothetical protein [Desulfobacterales bacterium]